MRITFNQHSQVIAGISERSDGSMVWWNKKPIDKVVRQNRDRYFKKEGIDPKRVVAGGIAHSKHVAVVTEQDAGRYLLNTDALVTNVSNLFLSITTADCLPVYYYNPLKKCIGIAHAGWQGLTKGILENVVQKLHQSYDSKPKDLFVTIEPHIQVCHYEVGNEVAILFNKQNVKQRNKHLFVDLANEAKLRLRKLGVKQISINPICTYCESKRFFSARHDKIEPLQGMVAYIGL